MSILMGSLQLGQDLCLYADESSEQSPAFDVSFQLQAIVNLTAVKLFMFKRDRWRVAIMEQSSGLTSFLGRLFNEETNLCGTTKKALLVQVNKTLETKRNSTNKKKAHPRENTNVYSIGTDTIGYPLPSKSNLIIYGERRDANLFIYAHPLIDDMKFLPVYESSTTMCPPCDDLKNDQMVLDEIFGEAYAFDYDNLVLSAQLTGPTNKLTETDIVDKIAYDQKDKVEGRDLIAEAKNAMQEKHDLLKMNRKPGTRISKSKPTKLKQKAELSPYNSLTLEKKNVNITILSYLKSCSLNSPFYINIQMIKALIKETLESPAKEDKSINQLIYSSVRYIFVSLFYFLVLKKKLIAPLFSLA
ncbi:hypothetical protein HPULCUR_008726 [Helicostylum pulchrum]|uniref:Uncharacterized protein n=1 Tax=Helicostylum pulchrum TaxID=562976 RepID=A0ABP9Y8F0_9FUNG